MAREAGLFESAEANATDDGTDATDSNDNTVAQAEGASVRGGLLRSRAQALEQLREVAAFSGAQNLTAPWPTWQKKR